MPFGMRRPGDRSICLWQEHPGAGLVPVPVTIFLFGIWICGGVADSAAQWCRRAALLDGERHRGGGRVERRRGAGRHGDARRGGCGHSRALHVVACGARASRVSRAPCCPATPPPAPRTIGTRRAPSCALLRPCERAFPSPPPFGARLRRQRNPPPPTRRRSNRRPTQPSPARPPLVCRRNSLEPQSSSPSLPARHPRAAPACSRATTPPRADRCAAAASQRAARSNRLPVCRPRRRDSLVCRRL